MKGSVENGEPRAEVVIGRLTDPAAGVRIRDGIAEIGVMTRPGFMTSFPRKILVNGREMIAMSARKSDQVKNMLVLSVDWVPPADV